MKKAISPSALLVIVLFASMPLSAQAQCPGFPYWGGAGCPIVPCAGFYKVSDDPVIDFTPLGGGIESCVNLCQLLTFVQRIIYFGMSLAVFVLAPIFISWGGVMIMIARGTPSGLERGKKILFSAIIGLLLALGAFLIVNTFFWALSLAGGLDSQFVDSAWPTIRCRL